ncbi:hypothetical protein LCGC14_2466860 [marine sediment metagenome]|uniref:Uncharacterized protein n=1 Tax=marine sediment metagenome TaxID=412755 RepID=A0A0F9BZA9_9ZZZZ
MVKKEVVICDSCENKISIKSCGFCKKDVCEACSSYISFDIYNGRKNSYLDKMDVCQSCYNNIEKVNPDDFPEEFKKKIRKQMTEKLKKIVLVKAFDKEPEDIIKGGKIGTYMGVPVVKSKVAMKKMNQYMEVISKRLANETDKEIKKEYL